MNCCDYECHQGPNCPARQGLQPTVTHDDSRLTVTEWRCPAADEAPANHPWDWMAALLQYARWALLCLAALVFCAFTAGYFFGN